jgi:hypothetical protein
MGAYGIGLLCGIFMFAYESVTSPSYLQNGGSLISVEILYAFGLGFTIALAVGSVIDAGVTTLFVALAEDVSACACRATLFRPLTLPCVAAACDGEPRPAPLQRHPIGLPADRQCCRLIPRPPSLCCWSVVVPAGNA